MVILFSCFSGLLKAQEQEQVQEQEWKSENNELKLFPAQISVYYPVGTHGRQSQNYSYNFSINMLYGKTGGINGLEFSGLYGRVRGDVSGIQVAGLANRVDKEMKGIQMAGLSNVVGGGLNGIQMAGLANVVGDGARGIQLSSLTNVVGDGMKGIQVSGFANVIGDEMNGIQVSGFASVVGDEMKGIQVSGFASVVGDHMKGTQISGFASVVGDDMDGIQISGIANVAGKEMKGIQIAGVVNATDNMGGIQIAGIYNRTTKMTGINIGGIYNRINTLNGLQIGIVSINDTIEKGISMSVVNIVKNGAYKEWELSVSDYANVALSFKMGMQNFYTIYTAGATFIEDNLWIFGGGFGNRTPINSRFDFQHELMSCYYFPSNFKNINHTYLTRLKLGFVYNLNEKFGLSLAPSVYVMNTKKDKSPESEYYKITPFGAFYTKDKNFKQLSSGVGVTLAINMR